MSVSDLSLLRAIVAYVESLCDADRAIVRSPHTRGRACLVRPRLLCTGSVQNTCVCVSCQRIVHVCSGASCRHVVEMCDEFRMCPYTQLGESVKVYISTYEEEQTSTMTEGPNGELVPKQPAHDYGAEPRAVETMRTPVVFTPRTTPTRTNQRAPMAKGTVMVHALSLAATDMLTPLMDKGRAEVVASTLSMAPTELIAHVVSVIASECVRHWFILHEDMEKSVEKRVAYPYTTAQYTYASHVVAIATVMRRGGHSIDGKRVLREVAHVDLFPIPDVLKSLVPQFGTGTKQTKRLLEIWREHKKLNGSWDRLHIPAWG